ncbi:hypothetical protein [Fodinicola feengrottensis]|uniref:hypothetical protein n=1 Tax=Fodinicola feengrottensis TaxID=435914 RepID=UPI002442A667|nr:hypothetical protein [Fodinicola feengrottensis]
MTSLIGVTAMPASVIRPAVDPVETICTPDSASPRASSTSPVLSYTLISARRIGTCCPPAIMESLPFFR